MPLPAPYLPLLQPGLLARPGEAGVGNWAPLHLSEVPVGNS